MICSDQFIPRWRVHAIEARRNRWRATNADVDLHCARLAHHAHDFAASGAAHDRIVHKDDAPSFKHPPDRVEFEPDAEIANGLLGFDKSTADIMIANQTHAERDPGFRRVTDSRGHAGIRHGHDDVCLRRMLSREQAPKALAALVYLPPENDAVRPRKIDMLENAVLMGFFRREVD